jgi:hypothetical protein
MELNMDVKINFAAKLHRSVAEITAAAARCAPPLQMLKVSRKKLLELEQKRRAVTIDRLGIDHHQPRIIEIIGGTK